MWHKVKSIMFDDFHESTHKKTKLIFFYKKIVILNEKPQPTSKFSNTNFQGPFFLG